jgi:hypothetical protein
VEASNKRQSWQPLDEQLLNELRLDQDRNAGTQDTRKRKGTSQGAQTVAARSPRSIQVSRLPFRRPGVSTKDLLAGWRKIFPHALDRDYARVPAELPWVLCLGGHTWSMALGYGSLAIFAEMYEYRAF